MTKIRIGKDIALRWAILTNGEPDPLQGRDLRLVMIDPLRRKISVTAFDIDGNIISFRYSGSEQKSLGRYSLTLWENYGKVDMTAVDACNVFELVSTTCQEPTSDMEGETLELQSNIQIGIKGASAYEIAVENGFQGTVEEWLQSLRQPAEDAASEAKEQIEAMKTLNSEVTEAENLRKQSETSRTQAENSRVSAEQQRQQTFTQLQTDIESLKNEASTAIENANEATSLANKAAEMANQATQSALAAADSISRLENSITLSEQSRQTAETTREQHEQSRQTAETDRSSAEQSRVKAETGRSSAEQSRSQAETTREQQEQSRQTAEQSRATEFAQLKQESETATENANEATSSANAAAEKANQAAETVAGRLSETYVNFAAIESSGETNKDKIYIDAETNTSYRYDTVKGEFVSIGGGSSEDNLYSFVSSFNAILGGNVDGNSIKPFDFQGRPIVETAFFTNKAQAITWYNVRLNVLSLDKGLNKNAIGYYLDKYKLIFIHVENSEIKAKEEIDVSSIVSKLDKIYTLVDIMNGRACVYYHDKATKAIVLMDDRNINVTDTFNVSYLVSSTRPYGGLFLSKYTNTNIIIGKEKLLGYSMSIGNYLIENQFGYRPFHIGLKTLKTVIKAKSVSYELQEGVHVIATVDGSDTFTSFGCEINKKDESALQGYQIVRFKILSGSCTINVGNSGCKILKKDTYEVIENGTPLELNQEYILTNGPFSNISSSVNSFANRMTGIFKVEIIDNKVCYPHEVCCCAERIKNGIVYGTIPFMVSQNSKIFQSTPLITTETKQDILGQQRVDTQGNVYITVIDESGNYIEKKITS